MEKRDKTRQVQDEIIAILDKRNTPNYQRLSKHMPESITLGEIRAYIFDAYLCELEDFLAYLKNDPYWI
jgi:hypothetical protein